MRLLDDTSRLCGLAIQQIVLRTSYFLGPLILGPLIDRSCIIFSHLNECETSSNCINYDLDKLSFYIAISCVLCKLSATLFLWICSLYIKMPTNEELFLKN
ncbi:hypothetical protein MXB_1715 [Myxobolus squamalis]|nr:hypothetical protein MXB_1715 [Myxobolus squamalis]